MAERKGVFIWYEDSEQFQLLTNEQLGILLRALIAYSQYGFRPEFDDPAVMMAFSFLAAREDRESVKYELICEKRREAGKKGGRPEKANAFTENQEVPDNTNRKQKKPTPASTPAPASTLAPAPAQEHTAEVTLPPRTQPTKQKYGQYGWVQLTDTEYGRLLLDLGDAELQRCIAYIDESAQTTSNKNHWRDWNLVIRKCHRDCWGVGRGTSPRISTTSTDAMDDLRQLHQRFGEEVQ